MAVGEPYFFEADFEGAVTARLQEAAHEGLPEQRPHHVALGGWYSSEVMAMALQRTPLQNDGRLKWELALQPLDVNPDSLPAAVGAISNIANRHWVALKVVDEKIWLLDSMREGPLEMSVEEKSEHLHHHPWTYVIFLLPEH